ncbi:hypothetical protein Q7P37_006461 [Cladosporium fusiforme]
MLREVPSFVVHAENEHGADMDVPMAPQEHPSHNNDLFDDIFGSAPASPELNGSQGDEVAAERGNNNEVSDIPRLRSRHVTEGYREGIAESKEKYIQAGFDEGYSLGAELGLKAGWCLGVLEGICKAWEKARVDGGKEPSGCLEDGAKPTELYEKAKDELQLQKLFDPAYFGTDGIWLYDVPGAEEETTFRDVALAHPVLSPWMATARSTANTFGLVIAAELGRGHEQTLLPLSDSHAKPASSSQPHVTKSETQKQQHDNANFAHTNLSNPPHRPFWFNMADPRSTFGSSPTSAEGKRSSSYKKVRYDMAGNDGEAGIGEQGSGEQGYGEEAGEGGGERERGGRSASNSPLRDLEKMAELEERGSLDSSPQRDAGTSAEVVVGSGDGRISGVDAGHRNDTTNDSGDVANNSSPSDQNAPVNMAASSGNSSSSINNANNNGGTAGVDSSRPFQMLRSLFRDLGPPRESDKSQSDSPQTDTGQRQVGDQGTEGSAPMSESELSSLESSTDSRLESSMDTLVQAALIHEAQHNMRRPTNNAASIRGQESQSQTGGDYDEGEEDDESEGYEGDEDVGEGDSDEYAEDNEASDRRPARYRLIDDLENYVIDPEQMEGLRHQLFSEDDSDLSELEATPVPEDPELVKLENQRKLREKPLCVCKGWCSCLKYDVFLTPEKALKPGDSGFPSQTHLPEHAITGEGFPESALRSTLHKNLDGNPVSPPAEPPYAHVYSWDQRPKPRRPPPGWEGVWIPEGEQSIEDILGHGESAMLPPHRNQLPKNSEKPAEGDEQVDNGHDASSQRGEVNNNNGGGDHSTLEFMDLD